VGEFAPVVCEVAIFTRVDEHPIPKVERERAFIQPDDHRLILVSAFG